MILSALLPLILFTSSYTSFNSIIRNNYDEVTTDNICFIYKENIEIAKIEFDYMQETSKLYFDTFAIDFNYYNHDTGISTSSSLIYFDELVIQLPFFSTNISSYYFECELDDCNVYTGNDSYKYIETFWNLSIEYYDETREDWQSYGTISLESEVMWSISDINVIELLNYYDPSFELDVYNINEVYQSLKDTYDESYSLGYDEGFGLGRDVGYETGYDEGFDEGFGLGRDVGYETGYHEGYDEGFDVGSGENKGVLNFIKSIFNTINALGNVEILPYIKIWYIIGIPVILAVVRFALGWFR